MALICINDSNRIRLLYEEGENAFGAVYFWKKVINNNYRCDRSKLKAIESKKIGVTN